MSKLATAVVILAALGCGRRNFNEDAGPGDATPIDAPIDAPPPRACEGAPVGCTTPTTYTCGGTCYVACADSVSRPVAATACAEWGGCLATIPDQAANDCAASRVQTQAWIGALQANTATTPADGWAWCDGSPLTFTAGWRIGEPDDIDDLESGQAQCASIDTGGGWFDDGCTFALEYVCSRSI